MMGITPKMFTHKMILILCLACTASAETSVVISTTNGVLSICKEYPPVNQLIELQYEQIPAASIAAVNAAIYSSKHFQA